MDFTFNDTQLAVQETANGLFSRIDTDRVAATEATDDRIDRELWSALASADLLGLAVPETEGGGGLGLTELCLVLEAQGTVVAPVPFWATTVLGVLPIGRFGTPEQRERWLTGVATGDALFTAALSEASVSGLGLPSVRAEQIGQGWRLSGTSMAVPQAHVATRIIVPARTENDEVVIVVIDPSATGARLERATTTNREIHPHLHLDEVSVSDADVLVGTAGGKDALQWMLSAAWTGLCALQVGVCEAAIAQTAGYLNERHQFERPLSTFQGTMLRAADAAIDIEAMRVTLWQAAWRIDTDRDTVQAVAIAKWQSAERGQRVVHSTQHLHGGMGADITYPIHRYFFWGKQIELLLGGPAVHLARLGADMAKRFRASAGTGHG